MNIDFDFFNLTFFGKNYDRFAIFNIADSSVTIGIVLLLFLYRIHGKAEIPEAVVNSTEVENLQQLENISDAQSNNSDISQVTDKDQPENGGINKGKETPL